MHTPKQLDMFPMPELSPGVKAVIHETVTIVGEIPTNDARVMVEFADGRLASLPSDLLRVLDGPRGLA